jgi:glucose/arabinose dehydrogenase
MRRWWLVVVPAFLGCTLFGPPGEVPNAATGIAPIAATETIGPTVPPATDQTVAAEPAPSVTALPDPAGFTWTAIVGGFQRPLDIQHAGDDRLFVVEQRGVVWVLEGGALRSEPFLDISDRVNDGANEQGLLGLAFHPGYASNGLLFVNYTDERGDTVIARYQVSTGPDRANPDSEVVLLRIAQPYANHNGGGLAFGPDGTLYIATGDGGSAGDPQGNGQRLDTLLGKILRIDVNAGDRYAIPGDNPFVGSAARGEIWAYGLRNPWRFSFDALTGDLWIGDVGQSAWEEVDFQAAGTPGGVNYGWNLREGNHAYSDGSTAGLADPVAEYAHSDGCSVTGGVVVRTSGLPEWQGVYLYGDYCSGRVWGLLQDAAGQWQSRVLFETGFNVVAFGQDQAGRVYVVDHRGGVYRLERAE